MQIYNKIINIKSSIKFNTFLPAVPMEMGGYEKKQPLEMAGFEQTQATINLE